MVARGQTIYLPAGKHNCIYILAASTGGDRAAEFKVGGRAVTLNIRDWGGFIGQWIRAYGRLSLSVTGQYPQITLSGRLLMNRSESSAQSPLDIRRTM